MKPEPTEVYQDEVSVWAGRPSQWINLHWFVFAVLFCWLLVPIFLALWKWLVVRNTEYEISSQRILMASGVINTRIHELELYRVKDYSQFNPLYLRLFKLGNVIVNTSDRTHPQVTIRAIKNPSEVQRLLRTQVERRRTLKGVRELDT